LAGLGIKLRQAGGNGLKGGPMLLGLALQVPAFDVRVEPAAGAPGTGAVGEATVPQAALSAAGRFATCPASAAALSESASLTAASRRAGAAGRIRTRTETRSPTRARTFPHGACSISAWHIRAPFKVASPAGGLSFGVPGATVCFAQKSNKAPRGRGKGAMAFFFAQKSKKTQEHQVCRLPSSRTRCDRQHSWLEK